MNPQAQRAGDEVSFRHVKTTTWWHVGRRVVVEPPFTFGNDPVGFAPLDLDGCDGRVACLLKTPRCQRVAGNDSVSRNGVVRCRCLHVSDTTNRRKGESDRKHEPGKDYRPYVLPDHGDKSPFSPAGESRACGPLEAMCQNESNY